MSTSRKSEEKQSNAMTDSKTASTMPTPWPGSEKDTALAAHLKKRKLPPLGDPKTSSSKAKLSNSPAPHKDEGISRLVSEEARQTMTTVTLNTKDTIATPEVDDLTDVSDEELPVTQQVEHTNTTAVEPLQPPSHLAPVDPGSVELTAVSDNDNKARLKEQQAISVALRWRARLLEAWAQRQSEKFKPLLRQADALTVSAAVLAQTGIGFLAKDSSYWPQSLHAELHRVYSRWRDIARGRNPDAGPKSVVLSREKVPLRGIKAAKFLEKADHLGSWMYHSDKEVVSKEIYQEAAFIMTLHGIDDPAGMDGFMPQDAGDFTTNPVVASCLSRAFARATTLGRSKRAGDMEASIQAEITKVREKTRPMSDALQVADSLVTSADPKEHDVVDTQLVSLIVVVANELF